MDLHKQILGTISSVQVQEVKVEEWGDGPFFVKAMSLSENREWAKFLKDENTTDHDMGVQAVIRGLCDSEGALVFTQDDAEDIERLQASTVGTVLNAFIQFNSPNPTEDEVKN